MKKPDETIFRHMRQRLKEGVLLFGFGVSLYLLISLFSFYTTDPGWFSSGSGGIVKNSGGRVGAWFADCFFNLFGYLAFLFPFVFAYSAWSFLREREAESSHAYLQLLRLAGFIIVILSGSGLASLHIHSHLWVLPLSAGGILGDSLGFGLADKFNFLGSTLFLLTCFLVGSTWLTGISWPQVIKVFTIMVFESHRIFITIWQKSREKLKTRWEVAQLCLPKPKTTIEINTEHFTAFSEDIVDVEPIDMEVVLPATGPVINKPAKRKVHTPSFKASKQKGLPSVDLLERNVMANVAHFSADFLRERSKEVEMRLKDFSVDARVVAVHPGPVITRYELALAPGLKVSKITGLAKDIARSLSMISVRVVDVIPGKSVIGLELPNETRETVRLRELLESDQYSQAKSPLSLVLGKNIAGNPIIVDLAKMPHLLVAGTTGSGKSVGVNAMLLSILFKSTPEQVRLILVDPKMLELSIYDDIPHLLTPVVTDMKDAANALRWCVAEMERRYKLMAAMGVRNLAGFNKKVHDAIDNGKPLENPLIPKDPMLAEDQEVETLEKLPSIVVVVDEFADMIMVVGKKVEQLIARIAQKARAAGIHLILATQRPSVDVITGLIKANIPTRISFQVSSRVDSRTILDQHGAEQLLGQGDMLYLPPGSGVPMRVHGAFVADEEVHAVVDELKRRGEPAYLDEIVTGGGELGGHDGAFIGDGDEGDAEQDEFYDQAVAFITKTRRASISGVQRKFRIGYNRAARIIEQMEASGIVSAMDQGGGREVLAAPPPKE